MLPRRQGEAPCLMLSHCLRVPSFGSGKQTDLISVIPAKAGIQMFQKYAWII